MILIFRSGFHAGPPAHAGILTGHDLDTIEKTGRASDAGLDALPRPIPAGRRLPARLFISGSEAKLKDAQPKRPVEK